MAVLTLSDSVSRGEQVDTSGDVIAQTLTPLGAEVVARDVLPDDAERISAALRAYADGGRVDLVVTTGGSGLAPRDVTPEATLQVVDRLIPGIPEAARIRTLAQTVRGRTLIINLPGSPKAVREWLDVILPVLAHAVELLQERPRRWGEPHQLNE